MTATQRSAAPLGDVTAEEWHGWGWADNRHPDLHIGPWQGQYLLFLEWVDEEGITQSRGLAQFLLERDARAAMAAIDLLTGHRP